MKLKKIMNNLILKYNNLATNTILSFICCENEYISSAQLIILVYINLLIIQNYWNQDSSDFYTLIKSIKPINFIIFDADKKINSRMFQQFHITI